jgi:biopolymer transport protein ExbD
MADIEQGGHDEGKKRSKKMSTKVDMTPMVDLAFLLVTFFMLTTTMNKPKAMELIMPEKPKPGDKIPEVKQSTVITVMPTKNNKVVYYEGLITTEAQLTPLITDYASEGLRKILIEKKKKVDAQESEPDKMIAIIKPAEDCTYKNLVDTIDEMAIVGVKRYAITDLAPQEKQMLAAAKL